MKLFLTLTILLSTLTWASTPYLPEVNKRFLDVEADVDTLQAGVLELEQSFSSSGSGVFSSKVAIVEIGFAAIAAASNVVVSWNVPANALVTNCFYEVTETFTSASDAATIGFFVESAGDIVAAAAISTGTTWDATGAPVLGVPDWATVADAIKMAAAPKNITVVRGGAEVLTAGNVILYCQYFQGK